MTIRVALHHRTHYRFDRPVNLSPHEVRLRPAAHCRTPIDSYSLLVLPKRHFINWQQDPYGNWLARLVFPEKSTELSINVDLVAEMTVINPFDFFVEKRAENFPFEYSDDNRRELAAYLELLPVETRFSEWLASARRDLASKPIHTIDFLVALNQRVQRDVQYLIRMEPGVQTPEVTLVRGQGSCRDSGWLLVQALRHFGIAARFASGYLIQLVTDQKSLDGPSGTDKDFTDLHAWAEAYLPGAGWVGLDPTSGLLAGEGHIPLACTAIPSSAAPVSGFTDVCESSLDFSMTVTRIHEDPRVTKPYSDTQWREINDLGAQLDGELAKGDVRLTMGGEPTFVSVDDMEGAEWNFTALSPEKFELATTLIQRLAPKFAPGGLIHFGQGKWYPGEPLPRWALTCLWRRDGVPLWNQPELIAFAAKSKVSEAKLFAQSLAENLGLPAGYVQPAFESVWQSIKDESAFPINIDPLDPDLKLPGARGKLREQLAGKIGEATGFVLPLKPIGAGGKKSKSIHWQSSLWPMPTKHIFLVPGDSPMGFRLPLGSLPWVAPKDADVLVERDPFDTPTALPARKKEVSRRGTGAEPKKPSLEKGQSAPEIIRTALCVEVREGILHVFLPPVELGAEFVELVGAIESTAISLRQPLRIEGYPAPADSGIDRFAVTPDPGVIEVNIHPSKTWGELVAKTQTLYEEARAFRASVPRSSCWTASIRGPAAETMSRLVEFRRPKAAPSPPGFAAIPHYVLAKPPGTFVFVFRNLYRSDVAKPAR